MIEQLFVRDASVVKRIYIYPEILATDTFWDLINIYFVILDRVLEMTFYPQLSICPSKTYLKKPNIKMIQFEWIWPEFHVCFVDVLLIW